MPQLLPNGKQSFFFQNGSPLANGSVAFYLPGTTTPATTWADPGSQTPNPNPVPLDANGQAVIYGNGAYRQIVKDVNGVTIWDQQTSAPAAYADLSANTASNPGASLVGFDGSTVAGSFLNKVNRVVDSIAALRGLSKTLYTRAFVTGYYAAHDGGGGAYQYDPNDTTSTDNGGTIIVASDGGRWKLQHFGRVSVMQFGAMGDGTDNTTAIQNAVATGLRVFFPKPTSYYYVKNGITCATKGQIIEGDGRQVSIIKVDSAFNMSALGVFIASSGEEGPHFRNLKITFVQPDTAVRANLTNYPPALYMRSTPRFTVENVAITQAMTGIDMAGGTNSGGAFITQLEMSAYNFGINIDGAQDSVRINKLHFWNFDLTTNQASVFNDGNTIGVQTARCDDFHLSDSLFINNGAQLKLTSSASGTTFGEVINTDFDTYGGLVMSAGNLSVSGCFMSVGFAGNQAIYQTGGFLKVANSEIEAAVATTNPLIQLAGPGTLTSGYMEIAGGMIRLSGDQQAVSVSASSGTNALVMTGVQLQLPQNTSPTNPVIAVAAGGRATITSCRASDKGTGTGNLITVASDDDHIISDNALMGWALALPAVMTLSVVSNNSGPPGADFVGNYLVGSFKIKRFTGTLDASGNLTVAHGIVAAQQKGLLAQAFYKGASGEMKAMTFNYVDGNNFAATGGTASAAYRATIMWTETQQGW